jgi:predicted DNA-binding transcriptional regulator AlpA
LCPECTSLRAVNKQIGVRNMIGQLAEPKPRKAVQDLSPDDRRAQELLSFEDLVLFGIHYSKQHVYKLIAQGLFPRPVRLGRNRVRFKRRSILEYIDGLEVATPNHAGRRKATV